MLALSIDFKNNNSMSLSTGSVFYIKFLGSNDGRDFSGMFRFDLSTIPKSVYVIGMPKRDFLLIFINRVVDILSQPFFPTHGLTGSTV